VPASLGKFDLSAGVLQDCIVAPGCDAERVLSFTVHGVHAHYFGVRNRGGDKRVGSITRNVAVTLLARSPEEKEQWMEAMRDNILQHSTRCEGYLYEKGQRHYYRLSDGVLGLYKSARERQAPLTKDEANLVLTPRHGRQLRR
jgi:hypothetical protein